MKKAFVALILVVVAALSVGLFASHAGASKSDVATYTVYTYDIDLATNTVIRISAVECRGIEAAVSAMQIANETIVSMKPAAISTKAATNPEHFYGTTLTDTRTVRAIDRSKTTAATQRTRAVRTSLRS